MQTFLAFHCSCFSGGFCLFAESDSAWVRLARWPRVRHFSQIAARFDDLLIEEQERLVLELECIIEMDRRKLFYGCSSLWSCLVQKYCLEDHQAERLIRAARLMRRFPWVRERLAGGKLNLSLLEIALSVAHREKFTEVDCATPVRHLNVGLVIERLPIEPTELTDRIVAVRRRREIVRGRPALVGHRGAKLIEIERVAKIRFAPGEIRRLEIHPRLARALLRARVGGRAFQLLLRLTYQIDDVDRVRAPGPRARDEHNEPEQGKSCRAHSGPPRASQLCMNRAFSANSWTVGRGQTPGRPQARSFVFDGLKKITTRMSVAPSMSVDSALISGLTPNLIIA